MQWINIIGRLVTDPETRFTANNQKVTSFRMAVNRKRSGKEETTWFRITVWGDQFDKMISYLKKGSSVVVAGEFMTPEIYTDKEGKAQISLQINAFQIAFMPMSKPSDKPSESSQTASQPSAAFGFSSFEETVQGTAPARENSHYLDEEIPF